MTGNPLLTWIRFEGHVRYHAVWLGDPDLEAIHTWCDRRVEKIMIGHRMLNPRSKCQCCVRRIAKPYLIPERMKEMFRNRAGAV